MFDLTTLKLYFICMKNNLENISKANEILKAYNGDNPYIIRLKNSVYIYKTRQSINDFEQEYILSNHDKSPKEINKMAMIAEWYGKKKQEEWGLDEVPRKIYVTWLIGETSSFLHIFCIYRRSQEKAIELFIPKEAMITDILYEGYSNMELDLSKYEERSGRRIYTHQLDGVKFLLSRKKAILSLSMGYGKTFTSILAALEGGYEHVLIVSPSSVKKTWENELKLLVDEDDITIVQGSKWDDRKFTIINYDILDNFYEIPTQKINKKELNVDENGNVVTEIKEKEIVSRSKKIIDEAMANSQLFQAKYDLIIIDEAHRLSNNTSGRFKIMQDLIKRSNPKGVFELTGTMITNSSKNLYNLLKLIDVPITRNWENFMTRYCGAKMFFKKNERNAYTTMFLKEKKKSSWYDLTNAEKNELNELLESKCKKIMIPGEDQNLDELKEAIKPYYMRREKEELPDMVPKTIKCLHYEMTTEEKESYDKLWEEYLELQDNKELTEKNKKLIEVSLMRQWLADKMIPKTIDLANKCIDLGHKVVVFCAFDNEIAKLTEAFGDKCVYHNGKLNEKKKNEAVEKFQNDDNIKIFIGNIVSAGVGLTLTSSNIVIFNNFSFVPADCSQAEDRVHRLNQTRPCTVYYQSFNGTYFDRMLEIIHNKQEIIDKIILTEKEK